MKQSRTTFDAAMFRYDSVPRAAKNAEWNKDNADAAIFIYVSVRKYSQLLNYVNSINESQASYFYCSLLENH